MNTNTLLTTDTQIKILHPNVIQLPYDNEYIILHSTCIKCLDIKYLVHVVFELIVYAVLVSMPHIALEHLLSL